MILTQIIAIRRCFVQLTLSLVHDSATKGIIANKNFQTAEKKSRVYPSIIEAREEAGLYRRLPWCFSEGAPAALPCPYGLEEVHYYPDQKDLPFYFPAQIRGYFWESIDWEGEDPNLAVGALNSGKL